MESGFLQGIVYFVLGFYKIFYNNIFFLHAKSDWHICIIEMFEPLLYVSYIECPHKVASFS